MLNIATDKLKVGMYVVLPGSWLDHDFISNSFLIRSEAQLERLRSTGMKEVPVDPERSTVTFAIAGPEAPPPAAAREEAPGAAAPEAPPEKKWDHLQGITQELQQTINDSSLAPETKARTVYQHSITMMAQLFEAPTVQSIAQSKKAVGGIVDLVLNDNDTTDFLMSITSHDFYTYTHSVNVGVFSILLVKELYGAKSDHDLHELGAGFFLHDLGKVYIDSDIINKPGRLTDEEMQVMRGHPYQGYKILKDSGNLSFECSIIAVQHHERNDGTGYPRGLAGDDIHEYARICSIADVFDALTSRRSYKEPLDTYAALKVMKSEMLGHFHREIFDSFIQLF